MATTNTLKSPFPVEQLTLLDFGQADGGKDRTLDDAFVVTNSVKKFIEDRHSIILGPIGSGKSALFRLLKGKSEHLKAYKKRIIVPIEEAVSFSMLDKLVIKRFKEYDARFVYQMIWKFQIAVRVSEIVSGVRNFPDSEEEKEINRFLRDASGRGRRISIVERFVEFLDETGFNLETNVGETPISIGLKVNKKAGDPVANVDRIIGLCTKVAKQRMGGGVLVIIDKIDSFVAGQEYDVQRKYIESLLEVGDDIDCMDDISCKIFLRDDLFARLDFERLGYDKVNDNALRLEWSCSEIVSFIAKRIFNSLNNKKILTDADVLLTTDLSEYHLSGLNIIRLFPWLPFKKKIFDYANINKERDVSLVEKIDKATVTKVFPRKIVHKDHNGKDSDIDVFDFFCTHFKDGHDKTTPRNVLVFLKMVFDIAARYYSENPDQTADVVEVGEEFEWELLKRGCVYKAYKDAKSEYVRNISKVENEWSKYFSTFLRKRGNKKSFDFNWIKAITDLSDDMAEAFLGYLNYVGFLMVKEPHPDPKRRVYGLPIIYMSEG